MIVFTFVAPDIEERALVGRLLERRRSGGLHSAFLARVLRPVFPEGCPVSSPLISTCVTSLIALSASDSATKFSTCCSWLLSTEVTPAGRCCSTRMSRTSSTRARKASSFVKSRKRSRGGSHCSFDVPEPPNPLKPILINVLYTHLAECCFTASCVTVGTCLLTSSSRAPARSVSAPVTCMLHPL